MRKLSSWSKAKKTSSVDILPEDLETDCGPLAGQRLQQSLEKLCGEHCVRPQHHPSPYTESGECREAVDDIRDVEGSDEHIENPGAVDDPNWRRPSEPDVVGDPSQAGGLSMSSRLATSQLTCEGSTVAHFARRCMKAAKTVPEQQMRGMYQRRRPPLHVCVKISSNATNALKIVDRLAWLIPGP
jgi:hypothetical protein